MLLFALLIAMVVITARLAPIHSAKILLLMYIIFGGVFTAMMIGLRKSYVQKAKKIKTSWAQIMALFFIMAAASIYCSWFWLSGIHHHDFLDTPCGTYGFLLTLKKNCHQIFRCSFAVSHHTVSRCIHICNWCLRSIPHEGPVAHPHYPKV